MGFLAEQVGHFLLDGRHTGHTAHQNDLVNVGGLELGVGQGLLARSDGALDQILGQLFQLGPRELYLHVLGAGGVGGDKGQIDLCLHHGAQFNLGLFARFLQSLEGLAVLAQVNALIPFELVGYPVNDALVPVVASQERVAVGRAYFKDAFPYVEDGDVKCAAAQVKDGDGLVRLFVEAVGQR